MLTARAFVLEPSAAERVFGYHDTTITTWRTRADLARTELEQALASRNLRLPHLQLDELRTRLRSSKQALWLWLAIDPLTKILPVLHLGPRTQDIAHLVSHSLRQLLAPGCLPLFTSDGLHMYFSALTAHFGHWLALGRRGRKARRWQVEAGLIYGQVKKSYRRRKLVRVTHVMRLEQRPLSKPLGLGLGLSGRLQTACSERVNLTVRHGVAALARRTWATAKPAPQLLAHLEWWRASSHFVRPHASLRIALVHPRERGGTLLAQRDLQCTSDGSEKNQPTVDSTGSALLFPITAATVHPLGIKKVRRRTSNSAVGGFMKMKTGRGVCAFRMKYPT